MCIVQEMQKRAFYISMVTLMSVVKSGSLGLGELYRC